MGMFHSARAEYAGLKKAGKVKKEKAEYVQDIFQEIQKIAPNGIMQVGKDEYSQSYWIVDTNYATLTREEQIAFFARWCQILNSIDIRFKITYFNHLQNMDHFRSDILFPMKGDIMDSAREAFNDIIEDKVLEGKHGIETLKCLTITVRRLSYEDAKNYIHTIEANLFKNFAGVGASLIAMSANERLELLHHFYHPGEKEEFHMNIHEYIRNGKDWRNDIACSDMDFEDEYFTMGKYTGKTFFIDPQSYASVLSDEFISELVNVSIPSIFSVDYVPVAQKLLKEVLDVKYMGIEQEINRQQKKRTDSKNFTNDIAYKVRREKQEIEELMNDVRDNDQKGFWVGVNFLLLAGSKKGLESEESNIRLILDKPGLKMDTYRMRQREAVNTILPIGVRQTDNMRGLFTRGAAAFVPFYTADIFMGRGSFYYGINSLSKAIIMAKRIALDNASGFIFGIPGSGKSFTGAKCEIGQVLCGTQDDIIIVDPTREYVDVAYAFGGKVLSLSPTSNTHFNPLHIDWTVCGDKKEYALMKAEKSQLIMGICCQIMGVEFSSGHASVIDRCVGNLYDEIYILPPEERYVPILSDLKRILEKQPEIEAQKLLLTLERFIDGSLNVFNHISNVDVNSKVMVYECRDMGEALWNISMTIMLDNITNKINENQKKGVATWIYIDEMQTFLENPYTRDYFILLWTKIRKCGGIPTALAQNITRILSDDKIATMISNSEYCMFLKQGGKDADAIIDTFDFITPAYRKYLVNPETKGCGIIRFGNVAVPFNNHIDPNNPIYDIYNTNFHEKVLMRKMKDSGVKEG